MQGLENAAVELNRDPNPRNWAKLSAEIRKKRIRYYKITFDNGKVAKKEDLRRAYAELYDSKKRLSTRIPIYRMENGRLRGATEYLKGLNILNP